MKVENKAGPWMLDGVAQGSGQALYRVDDAVAIFPGPSGKDTRWPLILVVALALILVLILVLVLVLVLILVLVLLA